MGAREARLPRILRGFPQHLQVHLANRTPDRREPGGRNPGEGRTRQRILHLRSRAMDGRHPKGLAGEGCQEGRLRGFWIAVVDRMSILPGLVTNSLLYFLASL